MWFLDKMWKMYAQNSSGILLVSKKNLTICCDLQRYFCHQLIQKNVFCILDVHLCAAGRQRTGRSPMHWTETWTWKQKVWLLMEHYRRFTVCFFSSFPSLFKGETRIFLDQGSANYISCVRSSPLPAFGMPAG